MKEKMKNIIIKDFVEPKDLLLSIELFFKGEGKSITYIDTAKNQAENILLEYMPLKGDYSFELCIYKDIDFSIKDLSIYICQQFKTEILINDGDINPYTWILITKDGDAGNVSQIPTDDDLFLIQKL